MYLTDPDSLRDPAAIEKAQAEVNEAVDPIDRVKALTALERAQVIDGEVYRRGFLQNIREWVEATGVSVSSLRMYGVPDEDLVEARLVSRPVARAGKVKAPVRNGTRSPRLDPMDVAAKMRKGTKYRLSDIAELIDREPATTRNYVNKLLAEGVVDDLGGDPAHDGKGMAPRLYRLAR
jgi:hypothetical protein